VQVMEKMITITEAAESLGVSTKTVRRWIEGRELRHYRLGRAIRIRRADLTAFVEDRLVDVITDDDLRGVA